MITWIIQNIATLIICLVLLLIVAAIITSLILNKKKGRSSCGCGCSGCPMNSSCNSHRPQDT